MKKILKNILEFLLKRKYFIGLDLSNGIDYSCKIYGYKDKNGIIYVNKFILNKDNT